MSWLCAEAQTVGFQIRTQGLLFQSTFFFSHQHVSRSFLSFCFALILSLARGSSPTLSRLPVKTGGDPGCLVSGTSAAGCSDNRENFFYFIWVSHLCTSPIECEIGEVGRTEPARGFRHRWQGSYASPKNCVPALLWLLVNFQPFYQRCYKNSILKALSVGAIESDAKKKSIFHTVAFSFSGTHHDLCFKSFSLPFRVALNTLRFSTAKKQQQKNAWQVWWIYPKSLQRHISKDKR